MKPEIIFQTPTWYLLICILTAFGLSYFMYAKDAVLKPKQRIFLGIIRGILVFFIAFILLNPLIKTVKSLILKPKVIIVIDNSKSMLYSGKKQISDLISGLQALIQSMNSKGFEVEVKNLSSESIDIESLKENVKFNLPKSNLSNIFTELKNTYEGQNLSDVILISDGIINDGLSPTFQKFNFNVHSVGFGDTTLKKDVLISGITANRLAYLGNKFTVNVDIDSYLFQGKSSLVTIKNGLGIIIAKQIINFKNNDDFHSLTFELTADKIGKQRFIVEIQALIGEFSLKNNKKEIVIDVVNGKEKILLVAFAAHPDIKAFRSILEKNELFEVKTHILQSSELSQIGKDPFDILILHQLPDVYGSSNSIVNGLLAKQKPTLFIVGSKTNIPTFNGMQNVVGINSQLNKLDKTTANLNLGFKLFNLNEDANQFIDKLPPLSVPFGEYNSFPGSEVILFQKVSNIVTNRPLFAFNLNGTRKTAVLVGEGIWQWRMEEFANFDNHQNLDEILTKTLQLISIKEDKSKLKVYPILETFGLDEKIVFEAEAYNDLFEKVFDQTIQLKVISESNSEKSYTFILSKESSRFVISNLPAGLFNFTASTTILGKNESTTGQFLVTETELESLNSVADFGMLKTFSKQNNGEFVLAKNIFELRNSLEKKGMIDKIISLEELKDFINLRWVLIFIVLLITLEWGLRKFFGSY